MSRRPWKRLAALRAARRRGTEIPSPPPEASLEPIAPLEPPDDDREFVMTSSPPRGEPARAGSAA